MARPSQARLSLLALAAALAYLLATAPPAHGQQLGPTGTNLQIDDAAARELVGLVELLGGFSNAAADDAAASGGVGNNIASLAQAARAGLEAADGRVISAALSLPGALRAALQSQQSKVCFCFFLRGAAARLELRAAVFALCRGFLRVVFRREN
jgi:hypothetical protein